MALVILGFSSQAFAAGKHFDRMITVIFENTNYSDAIRQPFFKYLADNGAHFTNLAAITHPSQGNYIALTSGSLNGVSDDRNYNLNVNNIVDLLEAKGITWKAYAEGFPGNCFTGGTFRNYARKHVPFISYMNIQKNPARCAKIVNAVEFVQDIANNQLPQYAFYIPDLNNDGHDTGIVYADRWYSGKFSSYVRDANFMNNTVIVTTFDENAGARGNIIYTSIFGPSVKTGIYSDKLNLYSLLALTEENWDLGNLGKQDATAPRVPNIWR
jgi:hypothetical protein